MNFIIQFPEGYQKPLLPGRDLWTAALRSGQFRQGVGFLCVDEQYCCLGVLCKIQRRPTSEIIEKTDPNDKTRVDFDGDHLVLKSCNPLHPRLHEDGRFPNGVKVLTEPVGFELGCKGCNYGGLAGCNDAKLTFPQIADIIEKIWDNAEPNWETTCANATAATP